MKAKTHIKLNPIKAKAKHLSCKVYRGMRLAIVPHKNNDYRPHLIRRYGLIAIVFIVIGLQLGYNGAQTGNVLGRESDITISALCEQTNQARTDVGESTLKLNDKLNQAAYLKAQDMFADQYWAHVAPDGTQPWKWLTDVGYNYNEAGENLAKGFTSTEAVMTAWMNSEEHKANILRAGYQDVGFAVVSGELGGEQTILVVALYGSPAESAALGAQSVATGNASGSTGILTKVVVAIQSMTPAGIACLVLILFAIIVAIWAHIRSSKLPKKLRRSWYRHHGMYKTLGLMSLAVVVIFLYSSGQI